MTPNERPYSLAPGLDKARVALIYRSVDSGASHVGLGITAGYTATTLREHGIQAEVWPVPTAAKLLERLRRTHSTAEVRPTHVVLAAPWLPAKELAVIASEFPDVEFVMVSHSAVAFLAADSNAIEILRGVADLQLATHNVFVGGNATKFTDWATEAWGVNVAWLPNLYSLKDTFAEHSQRWSGGPLRLGLFGANRLQKNALSGAAAAVVLARQLRVPVELLVSSGRDEGGDTSALDQMTAGIDNLRLTRTGWLSWPAFRRLLRTVHLVFQPSWTESFNVVTADAIAEGVPVVASEAIDWVPTHWQAKADEPLDIARVGGQLLRDPDAPRQGLTALQTYVKRGVVAWSQFLAPQRAQIVSRMPPAKVAAGA